VGTSVAQTIQERREQFHLLRLDETLDPLNPAVNEFLRQSQALFLQQTGDVALSRQRALQSLEQLRQQQASALAYFDVFWVSAALAVVLVFLVLLMRRSVAAKGTYAGAE
jgi:MFS transporter, DHA2 family, multidrug resistance protein